MWPAQGSRSGTGHRRFLGGAAFPPESGARLADLVVEAQNDRWLPFEPPGAGEDVARELAPAGDAGLGHRPCRSARCRR